MVLRSALSVVVLPVPGGPLTRVTALPPPRPPDEGGPEDGPVDPRGPDTAARMARRCDSLNVSRCRAKPAPSPSATSPSAPPEPEARPSGSRKGGRK
jgi:hypothetical protein